MRFAPAYAFTAAAIFAVEVLIALYGKGFLRHTIGDVLATALVYAAMLSVFNLRPLAAAVAAFIFSVCVEIAQALHLIELLNLGSSAIARTVLGATFSWLDIIAYGTGAAGAYVIDRVVRKSAWISGA